MKGFHVFINGKKLSLALQRGVVSIFIEKTSITMMGIDHCTHNSIEWGTIKLNIGDKIKIISSEVEHSSPQNSIKPLDRAKMLMEYYKLKDELTKEGALA